MSRFVSRNGIEELAKRTKRNVRPDWKYKEPAEKLFKRRMLNHLGCNVRLHNGDGFRLWWKNPETFVLETDSPRLIDLMFGEPNNVSVLFVTYPVAYLPKLLMYVAAKGVRYCQ